MSFPRSIACAAKISVAMCTIFIIVPSKILRAQSQSLGLQPSAWQSTTQRSYAGWVASPAPGRSASVAGVGLVQRAANPSLFEPNEPVQRASYFQNQQSGVFPDSYPQSLSPPPLQGQLPAGPTGLRERADQNLPQFEANPGLRPVGSTYDAGQFVTGLPYVTPAPGRYPTSPYMGPRRFPTYQMTAYQQPVPITFASQSTVVPLQSNPQQYTAPQYQLPQYQQPVFGSNPTPGIYPTAYQQCQQVLPPPSLPPDGAGSMTYVPPTITPNWNPNLYSANNSGFRPLFSLGQENYNVVLGRGIIGQPTAYVPYQPIRNFLRYIFP